MSKSFNFNVTDISNKFTCKGDVIEHLYEIKEQFEERINYVTDDYLTECFNFLEKELLTSKYYDVDVMELAEEVLEIIFNRYIDIALVSSKFLSFENNNNNPIVYN